MSRNIFRAYAQSQGKEAKEFVRIESEMYQNDTLVTKSNNGSEERLSINYKTVLFWVFKKFRLTEK